LTEVLLDVDEIRRDLAAAKSLLEDLLTEVVRERRLIAEKLRRGSS
jgi:hypothetical protein